ncbi:MAG: hypothetical protein KFF73_06870 [Cyclobacteriaceae bacterium]|nr:hypothetical protein [Cyclobacteriaceae bacterium]
MNFIKYFSCIIVLLIGCTREKEDPACLSINFWYGNHQSFGDPGLAQRWINILGNVSADHGIQSLYYKLNGMDSAFLSWGQDRHRLAGVGDFNIEIHFDQLREGENFILVTAVDPAGHYLSREMILDYKIGNFWPLSYQIDWAKVSHIQEAVQVVDGHWQLTPEGIRTKDPWYDRIVAIGDSTWKNYEIHTSVIFHGYTPPIEGPPNYGVSHAALAMRWPGHDTDEHQPHVKWYPLGATCEFQLKNDPDSCRWRILGDRHLRTEDTYQHFAISLGEKYNLKAQVDNIETQMTRYRVKIWAGGVPEPDGWQLTAVEGAEDMSSGSALLIAHNSDVTFGNVSIRPIE